MSEAYHKAVDQIEQEHREFRKQIGSTDEQSNEKWHQVDYYGPSEPNGEYHNSPAGLVVDPNEPIQIHEATIDADSAGELIVRIYPQMEDGGVGYPNESLPDFRFEVSEGQQTIQFDDLELQPLPDDFLGYSFSINQSDVKLRRSTDVEIPYDIGIGTLRGASAASGSQFDTYYHFFNLKISSDRNERPITTEDGWTDVTTDSLNRVLQLKPPVRDWGASMQKLVNKARPGDLIKMPPGEYIADSPLEVNKLLAIKGMGANSDLRNPTGPRITPTGDFPIIETANDTGIRASGMHFRGRGIETGPGIVTHGRSVIDNITGERLNDSVIHLNQNSHDDNLNSSRVSNVAGRVCDGAVIEASKTTSAQRELNALELDVRMSFSCNHAVDIGDGFGNLYHVQQAEGTHDTVFDLDCQRSVASITYTEGGTKPVFNFQDNQNVGVAVHVGGSTDYDEIFVGKKNNVGIQFTRHSDPLISRRWSNIDVKGDFEIEDGALVLSSKNGTRFKIRPDENGNLTDVEKK